MIFLYLARRDKKGMKLVATFEGTSPTMRLENLTPLNLPNVWKIELEQLIRKDRLHYELWIESAANVQDLQKKMQARGYKHLPIITGPMIWLSRIPTGVIQEGEVINGQYPPRLNPLTLKKLALQQHRERHRGNNP